MMNGTKTFVLSPAFWAVILNLIGWIVVSAWTGGKMDTIQRYHEQMITRIEARIEGLDKRMDTHIEADQKYFQQLTQPGVLYAAPQKDNRN